MSTTAQRGSVGTGELDRHKRQKAMYDPSDHQDKHVTIIGLGNIGSHTALCLARMGVANMTLVDFDIVSLITYVKPSSIILDRPHGIFLGQLHIR